MTTNIPPGPDGRSHPPSPAPHMGSPWRRQAESGLHGRGPLRRTESPRPGRPSTTERPTHIYARDQVCDFRHTRAEWGVFSNFQPLAVPIAAGPWTFSTSEAVYQAAKFAARPDIQQRIADAPTARNATAIGRTPSLGIDPGWNAQRVDVMRWVLRLKREANAAEIDAVLAATGGRPIVEVSTRDPWWGARPVAERYEGKNVLGRLWMELRQQLRDGEPMQGHADVGSVHVATERN